MPIGKYLKTNYRHMRGGLSGIADRAAEMRFLDEFGQFLIQNDNKMPDNNQFISLVQKSGVQPKRGVEILKEFYAFNKNQRETARGQTRVPEQFPRAKGMTYGDVSALPSAFQTQLAQPESAQIPEQGPLSALTKTYGLQNLDEAVKTFGTGGMQNIAGVEPPISPTEQRLQAEADRKAKEREHEAGQQGLLAPLMNLVQGRYSGAGHDFTPEERRVMPPALDTAESLGLESATVMKAPQDVRRVFGLSGEKPEEKKQSKTRLLKWYDKDNVRQSRLVRDTDYNDMIEKIHAEGGKLEGEKTPTGQLTETAVLENIRELNDYDEAKTSQWYNRYRELHQETGSREDAFNQVMKEMQGGSSTILPPVTTSSGQKDYSSLWQ